MTAQYRPPPLADVVAELCFPIRHREHYTTATTDRRGVTWHTGRDHVTAHPSLLDQLARAASSGQTDQRGSPGYGSKPAACLEALDTLTRIDTAASTWVRWLGEDDPGDTKACILKLHGLVRSAGVDQAKAVTADARRWRTHARIVAGWDSPAWRPDNTCPLCATRGGLRVNLADQTGLCIECRETWEPEQIGLLADHIRAENDDTTRAWPRGA